MKNLLHNGAKKYCYTKYIKNERLKKDANIIKKGKEKSLVLEITVAGVPKAGAKALKSVNDFRDNLLFKFEDTGKNLLVYCENQEAINITDFQNHKSKIYEKSGCCILPNTYVLSKSLEYTNLLTENSSSRARFKE